MTTSKWIFVLVVLLICIGITFHPYGTSDALHAQNGTGSLGTAGFSCVVTVSTATTIQEVGGACLAPTISGQRLYITDINFSANASGIAADSFPTLKSGTKMSTACDTNAAVVWTGFTAASAQANIVQDFTTPIRLPINSELCWIESTAGSKTLIINGYMGQ